MMSVYAAEVLGRQRQAEIERAARRYAELHPIQTEFERPGVQARESVGRRTRFLLGSQKGPRCVVSPRDKRRTRGLRQSEDGLQARIRRRGKPT